MDGMTVRTETRNATLEDLAGLLRDQHGRKIDVVAPASAIESKGGLIHVAGTEAVLDEDGVTQADGVYRATDIFDEGVADKMGIPLPYVRKIHAARPDLYDANLNGWLHGQVRVTATQPGDPTVHPSLFQRPIRTKALQTVEADGRSFLLRLFRGDEPGSEGIARALLSDRYSMIDNLDVLTAALQGIQDAGVDVEIDGCDLTDRKMYVRVIAPQVQAMAPLLMRGYRNPFADPTVERAQNAGWDMDAARRAARQEGLGFEDGDEPIVFAGFVLSNSEVGDGAFSITPRLVIKVCRNGLTITRDAVRAVHLGGRMDEGLIQWSDDTQRKSVALVQARARDAVKAFCDAEFVQRIVDAVEDKAQARLTDPAAQIRLVGKRLSFDQATVDGVLDHFIRGGQMDAGGVLQAVTSYAQTIGNADKAMDVEAQALKALDVAATL
jgi:hypothetical protein